MKQIEEDNRYGYLYTSAPTDLIKILEESFEVVRAKKIKELILKTLKMFYNIMQQFQRALSKMLDSDPKLPHEFMIAQCNNCFLFFEQMEDLLQPVRDMEICTEDELEAHYSQRNVQQYFQKKIQSRLLGQITESLFRLKLKVYYERSGGFLELDMEHIFNESFKVFEDYSSKMSKSTSRQAWTGFLEQTVLCYIQCMLNSSSKIRAKSSDDAIAKIREDY